MVYLGEKAERMRRLLVDAIGTNWLTVSLLRHWTRDTSSTNHRSAICQHVDTRDDVQTFR